MQFSFMVGTVFIDHGGKTSVPTAPDLLAFLPCNAHDGNFFPQLFLQLRRKDLV
jgi:hypothetical protein